MSGAQQHPAWSKISRDKVKEVPRKAYWQTREAFRNSVSSLRRHSVDAPSLFGAQEDGEEVGGAGMGGGGGTRKGSSASLGSLRRKLSLRGGGGGV
ncbi:hypothetical protein B0A54_00050 [Friedmanniomyces endolithicus]|uniref:Uncharacterized protein n=1 Tax=Friedmanniomyces endolithicus TaxID=329885 RepID=A0A4U0VJK6_9PEZI|nr:hypothetical protein B0A54_00050 [Friedmanniomyces endolithicus]